MSKPLVFMMGVSPVFLPTDRRYAPNHMWTMPSEQGTRRFGFTAYAVRLLGEVYHLEWSAAAGATVAAGGQIGFVEGAKATSDLYAPAAGKLDQFNPDVLADPTLINTGPYDAGWLLTMADSDGPLLSPEEYFAHVEASWPLAQRMLKAQVNQHP